MNGFVAKTLWTACLLGGMAAAGCQSTGDADGAGRWLDRCWPQRYSSTARRAVVEGFAPQVQNGHVLDQTVWNYHFEPGSDKLSPGGMAKLDYIVRRRPSPDPNLFLATARDISYDPAKPELYAVVRRDLDTRRIASIQNYVQAQMVGRPLNFDIQIHDPYPLAMPGNSAILQNRAYQSGGAAGQTGAAGAGAAGATTTGGQAGASGAATGSSVR